MEKKNFIIRGYQIRAFDEALQHKFLKDLAKKFPRATRSQISSIVSEAYHYEILEEEDIIRFVKLFLENVSEFTKRPSWIEFVLVSPNFLVADKLAHLEKNIATK